MPSQKSMIKAACKGMYSEFVDYSNVVLNIPVSVKAPHVEWYPGKTKAGTSGAWMIDGRSYPGTAEQVIAHLNERAAYWEGKTRRKSEPVEK